MAKYKLNINGKTATAARGETLADAALGSGIFIPQDCCSGQCETCRVRVAWGVVDDRGTAYGDTVLACQATLIGDATVTFEETAPATIVKGAVADIRSLSPDVVEVIVALSEPMNIRPGQYVSARFAGYPERDYSPTVRLNGEADAAELVLHIKRLPGGIVSSEIGRGILLKHPVRIRGPLGSAFLREPPAGRLVMTSSGTGWAPIWAMARAACAAGQGPKLSIVAGARDPASFYMRPALEWLKDKGVEDLVVTTRQGAAGEFVAGTPDQFLPALTNSDVVHVAGAIRLVDAVKEKALAAAARCYADPFNPSSKRPDLSFRLGRLFRGVRRPTEAAVR